jgi:cytochrome b
VPPGSRRDVPGPPNDAPRFLGHNPAGGLMTVALLGMLVAISVTGVMMT